MTLLSASCVKQNAPIITTNWQQKPCNHKVANSARFLPLICWHSVLEGFVIFLVAIYQHRHISHYVKFVTFHQKLLICFVQNLFVL